MDDLNTFKPPFRDARTNKVDLSVFKIFLSDFTIKMIDKDG
jgi:hypothetical protein